ncbi:serine O-acetyltransferase, partial [Rhizobiaceae sp. 2RAB30]
MTIQKKISDEAKPLVSWSAIRTEAILLSEKEPLLRKLLSRFACDDGSLPCMMATMLADALQATSVDAAMLNALFVEVLSTDPLIEVAMSRDLQAVRDRDPACATYQ